MSRTALRSALLVAAIVAGPSSVAAQRAQPAFATLTSARLAVALRAIAADSGARPATRAAADSTPRDSASAAGAPARLALPRASRSPKVFYALMAGGVVAVRTLHLDSDPGGYRDGFRTYTDFPDKGVHALAAWALTNAGTDMRLSPWRSAAAVSAAGVGYELAQGYVSKYDIAADVVGAVSAAAWRSWRNGAK